MRASNYLETLYGVGNSLINKLYDVKEGMLKGYRSLNEEQREDVLGYTAYLVACGVAAFSGHPEAIPFIYTIRETIYRTVKSESLEKGDLDKSINLLEQLKDIVSRYKQEPQPQVVTLIIITISVLTLAYMASVPNTTTGRILGSIPGNLPIILSLLTIMGISLLMLLREK